MTLNSSLKMWISGIIDIPGESGKGSTQSTIYTSIPKNKKAMHNRRPSGFSKAGELLEVNVFVLSLHSFNT